MLELTRGEETIRAVTSRILCLLATGATPKREEGNVKRLLALIEKAVLRKLFAERLSTCPGAQTPLASWLDCFSRQIPSRDTKGRRDVLKIILACSEGADFKDR